MKKTKAANLLAGSTSEVRDGQTSNENMKHGEETHAMLLALLNSPLETMIANSQAKIIGRGLFLGGRVGTLIVFYETEPTANSTLKAVVFKSESMIQSNRSGNTEEVV